MDEARARKLVAAERARIEAALAGLTADVREIGMLERQQAGESAEGGSNLQLGNVEIALISDAKWCLGRRRQMVDKPVTMAGAARLAEFPEILEGRFVRGAACRTTIWARAQPSTDHKAR